MRKHAFRKLLGRFGNRIRPLIRPGTREGVYGHVDDIGPAGIRGWLLDGADPAAQLKVDVYLEEQFLGSGYAVGNRPDISKTLGRPADCEFLIPWETVTLPPELKGTEHTATLRIRVLAAASGREIAASDDGVRTVGQLLDYAAAGVPPLVDEADASPEPDNSLPISHSVAPTGVGHLDRLDGLVASGWAANLIQPNTTTVVGIFVDGELAGTTPADIERPDLQPKELPQGTKAGFEFPIPRRWLDGRPHLVTARIMDAEHDLIGSFTLTAEIAAAFTASMPSGTSSVRPPEPAPAAAHPAPVVDAPPSTSGRTVLAVDLVHADDYLIANPDLAAGGVDPVTHWLTHGFRERRSPSPGVTVRSGLLAERAPPESGWMTMTCRDENVAIRIRPLSRSVIDQIGNQLLHDPSAAAVGRRAIAGLRQFEACDLLDRDSFDCEALVAGITSRPDAVIVLPWLVTGGAEKYAADIAAALMSIELHVLVLVTDHTAAQDAGWEERAILAPLRMADVVHWKTAFAAADEQGTRLARLLNGIRPRDVFVFNSRLGYETVARYGRPLSTFARLHCGYFSLGIPDAEGVTYGRIFPRRTCIHATTLTDNEPTREALDALYGTLPGPGALVLPPCVRQASFAEFESRLARRAARAQAAGKRWAWVSRVEPYKGTAILGRLAALRPQDRFDVFGPLAASPAHLGIDAPNITCHGAIPDVLAADFTTYDGFVFTSLFEGMPNVVLEMSQHGLPMVLADVGGLRGTFTDDDVLFVSKSQDPLAQATAFDKALSQVASLPEAEHVARARKARAAVARRHSPEAFAAALQEVVA
ncbi:MAG: glycosyltransferase [Planctomycetia bacterium]|nr:glycosyltransferase [Planctomycetia bacterium]